MRSISFPFDNFSDFLTQGLCSSCCNAEFVQLQCMLTSLSHALILRCVTSSESITSNFLATFNDVHLIYPGECVLYKCAGVMVYNEATSRVTCANPSDAVNCADCCLILEQEHHKQNLSLPTVPCRGSLATLNYVSSRVILDGTEQIDKHLSERIVELQNTQRFDSTTIDSYMTLLIKTHYLQVHAVCSGWVSQRLFNLLIIM